MSYRRVSPRPASPRSVLWPTCCRLTLSCLYNDDSPSGCFRLPASYTAVLSTAEMAIRCSLTDPAFHDDSQLHGRLPVICESYHHGVSHVVPFRYVCVVSWFAESNEPYNFNVAEVACYRPRMSQTSLWVPMGLLGVRAVLVMCDWG